MKTRVLAILVSVLAVFSVDAQTLAGKELFNGSCKSCHSIGGGDIVGPDLAGVTDRRDAEWLKSFITNSQKMVQAGDDVAVELFNKYNKIAMPSHNFNEEQLNNLISYLGEAEKEAAALVEKETDSEIPSEETGVAQANADNGPGIFVQLILGFLGVAVALLSAVAIYLYRLLQS